METAKFRWIDESIDISDIYPRLPKHMKDMIAEIEQADIDDNLGIYSTGIDDLEAHTKLLIPDIITDKEWEMICNRYSIC